MLYLSKVESEMKPQVDQEILKVLGIRMKKADFASIDRLIRKGIPYRACNHVKKVLGLSNEELAHALGVSTRTLSLTERLKDNLPFVASDRIYRIARILVLAIEVFKKQEGAVEWLRSPQIALGGRTPFDTLLSEPGSKEVENLLGRIKYGVIS
jgi:putative toxin-antitoxin system antitoxin component (TIGR02293 family)